MPCSDSSSSLAFIIDDNEQFVSYEYAKISCGRAIEGGTEYAKYLTGKALSKILEIPYHQAVSDLHLTEEEEKYILFLEWDVLRCAIGLYLGIESDEIDTTRCSITSIEQMDKNTEVALVVLPPAEMPKILPCSLNEDK